MLSFAVCWNFFQIPLRITDAIENLKMFLLSCLKYLRSSMTHKESFSKCKPRFIAFSITSSFGHVLSSIINWLQISLIIQHATALFQQNSCHQRTCIESYIHPPTLVHAPVSLDRVIQSPPSFVIECRSFYHPSLLWFHFALLSRLPCKAIRVVWYVLQISCTENILLPNYI